MFDTKGRRWVACNRRLQCRVGGDNTYMPILPLAYGDVRPYPRAIAILMDGVAASLGCGAMRQAPTIRRSMRLPADAIDNIGIAPDVMLPWNEPDPITTVTRSYRR